MNTLLHNIRFHFLSVLLLFCFLSTTSHAATVFTVLNTNDSGPGSLRQAVLDANALAGDDKIEFDPSLAHETITLTTGEIVIGNDSLTIVGPLEGEANGIILVGNDSSRIFSTSGSSGLLRLDNMTLMKGYSSGTDHGGAMYISNKSLEVNDCVITSNTSDNYGGGVYLRSGGSATFNRSVITNNTSGSRGGGVRIYSNIPTTFNASLISHNTAYNDGGGIQSLSPITLNQSSVSNNISTFGAGGGIALTTATTTSSILNQSTVSGNTSSNKGGGIYSFKADITLNQTTITDNTSNYGAGLSTSNGNSNDDVTITMINSILLGNSSLNPANTGEFYHSLGTGTGIAVVNATNSLLDDVGIINGTTAGNTTASDPLLGPLQNNGGFTKTHRPQDLSPTLNQGSNPLATEPFDQRGNGFNRIVNTTVDIGAVEREANPNGGLNEVLKRGEMVRAILRKIETYNYVAPAASGLSYHDVQARDFAADWIEKFKDDGFTEGCTSYKFCANSTVSREEMAKFFYHIVSGANYPPPAPPLPMNLFSDVPLTAFNSEYITWLRVKGYTEGCDTYNFCPKAPVTKKWFNNLLAILDEI